MSGHEPNREQQLPKYQAWLQSLGLCWMCSSSTHENTMHMPTCKINQRTLSSRTGNCVSAPSEGPGETGTQTGWQVRKHDSGQSFGSLTADCPTARTPMPTGVEQIFVDTGTVWS